MKNVYQFNFKMIGVALMLMINNVGRSQPGKIDIEVLSSIVSNETERGKFSGVVLVAKGDSILFSKATGYSNHEIHLTNTIETRFNIASVGKLFTRIAVLQLIQEGKISFHDTIGAFFTGFNQPNANLITIHHLLEHKSGLGDVYVSADYFKDNNYRSQEKVVNLIAKEQLAFVPGTKDRYSNSGYYLLGAIISKVTGRSFSDAIIERIFRPLGMNNSGFANTGESVASHALPYMRKGSKVVRTRVDVPDEPPSGAGSEFSTVNDLFFVYKSIITNNKLLNDDSKALLFNKFQPANWDEIRQSGKITGYLGGDTRGWSAKLTFMFLKKQACCVIILANFDDMAHQLDLKLREVINKEN